MTGGAMPNKIIKCDIQEPIDKYNDWYDNIINKNLTEKKLEDELEIYASSLSDFLGVVGVVGVVGVTRKEVFRTLRSGKYHINAERFSGGSYKIELREKKDCEDIGITEEQILELEKFLDYLEQDDVVARIKRHNRRGAIVILIILPFIIYIILHTLLAKSFILTIIFGIFFTFVYIVVIMNVIHPADC